jgi:hypothetical protein
MADLGTPDFTGGVLGSKTEPDKPKAPEKPPETPPEPTVAGAKPAETEKHPVEPAKLATEPAKPTDAKENPADEPPAAPIVEEKFPRTSQDWEKFKANRKASEDKLKGEIAARESKVKEYEVKVAEYEKKLTETPTIDPAEKAEIDRIKAENAELNETVRRLNVTEHPKFKQYFGAQTMRQITLAKNIVGTEKAEAVEKLLNMPNSEYKQAKIDEFMGDLTPTQSTRLGSVMNKLEELSTEKEEAIKTELDRAQEAQAKEAKTAQERGETMAKATDKLFKTTLEKLQNPEDGHPAFQHREGDTDWNKAVDERIQIAKAYLSGKGFKPEDIAKAAFEAAAYPAMLDNQRRLYTENEQLKAQVAALSAAGPKAPDSLPGGTKEPENKGAALKPGMDFLQAGQAFAKAVQGEWNAP